MSNLTWRERLVTASFRNFEFLTESHDEKGGRRLVIKELPGGEDPVVEDLGGKAGEFRLNAYFLGDHYDLQRDMFISLLNTTGATWLIHPWRGRKWVRAHNWSLHESNDKGGYAAVTVDFVPGGVTQPEPQTDPVDSAESALDNFAGQAASDFDLLPMSAEGLSNLVKVVQGQLENLRNLIALASLPLDSANSVLNLVAGVKGDLATLMATPSRYASAVGSLMNALGAVDLNAADRDSGGQATVRAVRRVLVAGTQAGAVAANPVAAIRAANVESAYGDSLAMRMNVAREANLRARQMAVVAGQLALTDYYASDDRDAMLAGVVDALDGLLPSMPDAMFQAALQVRTALVVALSAQEQEPATSRDLVAALPAVVLAHRFGVDESIFAAQNRVRHPLFVQGRVYG